MPYCVLGGTALAEGRGECITLLPALPKCHVVMVKPDFPVSTPQLFSKLGERKVRCHPDTAGMLTAIERGDLNAVARRLYNVFEEVLPPKRRERVEELKRALLDGGALGSCMTGTGPTVFGIFDRQDLAEQTHRNLKRHIKETFLVKTI